MKDNGMPKELMHFMDTPEYKAWRKERRLRLLENFVFVLLLLTLIALSFTFGRLWEQVQVDKPKNIKSEFKITNDLKWKV